MVMTMSKTLLLCLILFCSCESCFDVVVVVVVVVVSSFFFLGMKTSGANNSMVTL